ncbi:Cyanovirin-N [Agrocybe pediades]|nr:Cyanovirin-N [Agrocybe pediades]
MPFSDTCEKITIAKGVLSAQCQKADGKHSVHSSISLNDYIGNKDGNLTWGGKGFSHNAVDAHVNAQGILSAKLKGPNDKLVESKLNLNAYIRNHDGVLEPIPVSAAEGRLVAPGLLQADSTASAASAGSASSMFSSISASSASSMQSSSVRKTSSSSSSTSTFQSSKFKSNSKLLSIEATCTNLVLKGFVLHLDCQRLDGTVTSSHINLDEIIGFVNGQLVWDHSGFSKHVYDVHLEGFTLVAKFKVNGTEHVAHLDLRTRLGNKDGVIILMELNNKLSMMLSEVPWMKFKVIAEPDLSIFAKHPVMQETLVGIAETTVEHVTLEMHKMLTVAMESAITEVTASAMKHVESQMQTLVMDVTGQATANASITGAESLHLFGQGGYGFGGYAAGGYAAGGYAAGGYSNGYYSASALSSPAVATPGLYVHGGGFRHNGHGPSPLQSPTTHVSNDQDHETYAGVAKHPAHPVHAAAA